MATRVFGRNFYAGRCAECGGRVPEESGYAGMVGTTKVVWCSLHKPSEKTQNPASGEASGVYFDLTEDNANVEVTLRGKLPREEFDRYRQIKTAAGVRGGQVDGVWRDVCAITSIGRLWKMLTDADFTVTASPRAVAAMEGAAQQQRADDTAVQARLSHPMAAGLFPFQRAGVEWLSSRTGALLADEMGCGKTVQTLMALGEKRPVLLVVPASLKYNWQKEAQKWRPEYKVTVVSGRGNFRYPKPGEIVVMNYDILPKAQPRLQYGRMPELEGVFVNPPARLTLVADEAHSLKNANAQRTENFRFLGDIARQVAGQVWLLTGTPLLNRPPELWSVFTSGGIAKEAFGSFENFKSLFNARQGRYAIEWGRPNSAALQDLIRRVQLRREKKDVLTQLPPKTRKVVYVDTEKMLSADRKLFDKTLKDMQAQEAKQAAAAARSAQTKEAAKAIATSPVFTEFSTALTALANAKVKGTIEYISDFIEEGVPFLVFSAHLEPLRAVKEAIEAKGKKCGIIIGDVANDQRQRVVEDFQAGRLDAVCIGIRAGGVGLTLTRATHSVFIDLEVVPALNVQAEDRIHRIGQTSASTIHQMVLDHPLDHHVRDLISRKMELFEATVGVSTYMPTDMLPTDQRASATVQAAAKIKVAKPASGPPPIEPVSEVRRVQYQTYAPTGRFAREGQGPMVTREAIVPQLARPAKTQREKWAARAIATLTENDMDMAAHKNEMGWSRSTGPAGHMFNAMIQGGYGLTDAQWVEAIDLLRAHRGQIGVPPAEEAVPSAERAAERRTRAQMHAQTSHPAEIGPSGTPDAVAPVPVAQTGVGQVGRGAHGQVTCVTPPKLVGRTPVPATFKTADGRIITVTGNIGSSTPVVAGNVYRVRFVVAEHLQAAQGIVTRVTDFWVLDNDKPAPVAGLGSAEALNEMMRAHRRMWNFRD